jgi:EpsD family peptidyl-prolyl cis-trans isomerase
MLTAARSSLFLPAVLSAAALVLTACSEQPAEQPPSQVLARVNKVEITLLQFNNALQSMGVTIPAESVRSEVTSKLIDREIAVQAATEAGMDKLPEVLLKIEEARRDVLARAFAERIGARATPPTSEEAERFYRANPGLFSARRIYRLREAAFATEVEQLDEIRRQLSEATSLNDVSQWSREKAIPFNEQIVIRSAEQLPMETLPRFQQAAIGNTVIFESPRGLMVYEVLDAQPAPVTLESARPIILDHLTRQAGRREVEARISTLRSMAAITHAEGFSPHIAADVLTTDAAVQPQ